MIDDNIFWKAYDKANLIAEKHPDWDRLEMQREFAFDQAGISDELREIIENTMDRQYLMIIWEMWKMWDRLKV